MEEEVVAVEADLTAEVDEEVTVEVVGAMEAVATEMVVIGLEEVDEEEEMEDSEAVVEVVDTEEAEMSMEEEEEVEATEVEETVEDLMEESQTTIMEEVEEEEVVVDSVADLPFKEGTMLMSTK